MGEVIELRRKKPPTIKEVVDSAVDYISMGWEKAAKLNKLQDFFLDQAVVFADPARSYMGDLNALSAIEQAVGLHPIIRAPLARHQLGWQVSFHLRNGRATTPDLPFETYARAFAVLLYLKLKRDLQQHGYTGEL